uniref:Uncharacterized protein n=1 Tax=Oryza sativa subsp. japonica TaxID=39947 RepID=Q6K243_ORYSJ|nr:hypothetical protein [Oryza sativa Japonica Group]BAD20115.1 hypothetical protein [Oryza sativa Japonica Group]
MATIDTTVVHIKIKPSKFCNLVHEYLMESSQSHLSNGSSFIAKFHPSRPKSQKEGIRLICTGKINNPRRGVSIAKAQHNVLYGCSRITNVSLKS